MGDELGVSRRPYLFRFHDVTKRKNLTLHTTLFNIQNLMQLSLLRKKYCGNLFLAFNKIFLTLRTENISHPTT